MTRTTKLLAATVAATILTLGLAAQPVGAADPIVVYPDGPATFIPRPTGDGSWTVRPDGPPKIITRPYLRPCHKRAATVIVVHGRGHRTCRR